MGAIYAKYSDVKTAILAVKQLNEDLGYRKKGRTALSDAYYQDYDIYELDWDFFLEEYEKRFNSTLEGLIYEKYFPEVRPLEDLLKFPLLVILKILSFCSFRKKGLYRNIIYDRYLRLEVGDLVLSVLNKKFANRSDYKLILIS
ncbi:hypothetical protein [Elizabethkingia meningoseptica]|uniref:hypothetical protein n=1 Tax=Elizabethkingia meningoseptica TaxID=238 RepID=UPI003891BD96